ncbi:MAG: 30S ribosomal protein THX [Cyclobacteriaceae bacterium]|nr:30S ribosomal protein THX [Cyclobacteriaceae bacterium]
MGKGDKKTKKGKIAQGSFGVNRPRKKVVDKPQETEKKKKRKKVSLTGCIWQSSILDISRTLFRLFL